MLEKADPPRLIQIQWSGHYRTSDLEGCKAGPEYRSNPSEVKSGRPGLSLRHRPLHIFPRFTISAHEIGLERIEAFGQNRSYEATFMALYASDPVARGSPAPPASRIRGHSG